MASIDICVLLVFWSLLYAYPQTHSRHEEQVTASWNFPCSFSSYHISVICEIDSNYAGKVNAVEYWA